MSQAGRQARRGPKGYKRSDERLKEDICEQLMQCTSVDSSEVTIEVQSGKVTLEGTVPERHMKHVIEDIADNCPGVEDVENRVRVSRGGSGSEGEASTGSTSSSSSGGTYAGGSSSQSSKKA
jgi:osmotically-inducible protein OsmY